MKLRATVVRETGHTKHGIGRIQDGKVVEAVRLPSPAWVEIAQQDGLYFLFSYTNTGGFISDTCHRTLAEAKEQARLEFDISAEGWVTAE